MDTGAKLLLANNVTVPSNGFAFHHRITEAPWRKIMLTVPGHNNKPCRPFVNCQNNDNNVFFLSIALSNTINRIVLLLTTNSSNNSIQLNIR